MHNSTCPLQHVLTQVVLLSADHNSCTKSSEPIPQAPLQRTLVVAAAAGSDGSASGGDLPHQRRRVVITGMGVTSSLGHDVGTFYDNLLAGKSGVSHITRFPADSYSSKVSRGRLLWDLLITAHVAAHAHAGVRFNLLAAKAACNAYWQLVHITSCFLCRMSADRGRDQRL
jgi:Beta-ketoacyl synthase, N-terminal domain